MKKLNTKYADLMHQAQKASGIKNSRTISKLAKLKAKFDIHEIM